MLVYACMYIGKTVRTVACAFFTLFKYKNKLVIVFYCLATNISLSCGTVVYKVVDYYKY